MNSYHEEQDWEQDRGREREENPIKLSRKTVERLPFSQFLIRISHCRHTVNGNAHAVNGNITDALLRKCTLRMTFIIVVVMSTERKWNAECVNVQMELNRISKASWRAQAAFEVDATHHRFRYAATGDCVEVFMASESSVRFDLEPVLSISFVFISLGNSKLYFYCVRFTSAAMQLYRTEHE